MNTIYLRRLHKGFDSKFSEDYSERQAPEKKSHMVQWSKRFDNKMGPTIR